MTLLAVQQGHEVFPLFIDYGQKAKDREYSAMISCFKTLGLPVPKVIDVSGYGAMVPSGLTSSEKDTYSEAFLPCRNLMFLTLGAAYGYEVGADTIAVGLLHDDTIVFPDQTSDFVKDAEALLTKSIGRQMKVLAPLKHMNKADVVGLAKKLGVSGAYSCHEGTEKPCGKCIACREYEGLEL